MKAAASVNDFATTDAGNADFEAAASVTIAVTNAGNAEIEAATSVTGVAGAEHPAGGPRSRQRDRPRGAVRSFWPPARSAP